MTDKKICTKCKERPRAYRDLCKECQRSINRANYLANREQRQQQQREYAAAHREEERARVKKWRRDNPDRRNQQSRLAYAKHHAKELARGAKYRESNRGRERERARAKYYRNPLAYKEAVRRRRARKQQAPGDYTQADWDALKLQYDHTCLRCLRQEPEIKLTEDHVIPLALGGTNFIDNIQPLCGSCNKRKHLKTTDYRKDFHVRSTSGGQVPGG